MMEHLVCCWRDKQERLLSPDACALLLLTVLTVVARENVVVLGISFFQRASPAYHRRS
jgi:hypothetical protein